MVFDSFNLIFFGILIIFSWIIPKSLLSILYISAGILFLSKYSTICLLLWVGVTTVLIFYYRFNKLQLRMIGWVLMVSLLVIAQHMNIKLETNFSFEIMLLFIYNMARAWSLLKSFPPGNQNSPSVSDVISFLWFPPILFSGPIERFEEFQNMHHQRRSICLFSVTKYFGSALIHGLAAYALIRIFNPTLFDFNKAELSHLIIYMIQASLLVVFQFIAWIHVVRGVCHLMGYNFSRPNFHNFLTAGGLLEFWIRWNMSFTKFIRDYIFFPQNRIPTIPEFIFRTFCAFTLYGPMHGINPSFFLWGILQAIGLMIQSSYRIACRRLVLFSTMDKIFFKPFKITLTLTLLVVTTPLLLPEGNSLYRNIWSRILQQSELLTELQATLSSTSTSSIMSKFEIIFANLGT